LIQILIIQKLTRSNSFFSLFCKINDILKDCGSGKEEDRIVAFVAAMQQLLPEIS
jgi:hypothetical protein